MPTTPTGLLSTPLSQIEQLVAASPSFQKWVGAIDARSAAAHVYVTGIDAPPGTLIDPAFFAAIRPYALISYDITNAIELESIALGQMIDQPRLLVSLWDSVDAGSVGTYKEAVYRFANNAGAVLQDIVDGSQNGGESILRRVIMSMPIRRATEKEQPAMGDFHTCAFSLYLGLAR